VPESYIQLPTDSTGKKMRTRQKVVAAQTVEEQFIALGAEPTYLIWTGAVSLTANRLLLSLLNLAASGQVLRVRKLFLVNAQLVAAAGIGVEYQVKRISAITGGTSITPNPSDTGDGALTNVTCVHSATSATEGIVLFSWYTNNDEIGLTGGFPQATIQALTSMLPEGPEIRELTLNPGEGFCLKQITSTTIGSMGALAVVTRST
jgi:hypothetical protein